MNWNQRIIGIWQATSEALLNSYSALFFSNNHSLALLLLIVSFFKFYAGISGLIAALFAINLARLLGLNKLSIQQGAYSYNALIIGMGMGSMYNFSVAFGLLFIIVITLSVILSVIFQNKLGQYGLPFLTLPFVLCLWIVALVAKDFAAIHLTLRNIFWLNEVYALGNSRLVQFILFVERLNIPPLIATFFTTLSSLYFQNNMLGGMIMAIGILIHSRIIFSLMLIGFSSAYLFNQVVMAHPEGINYYLLGGNYILVTVAIGGFFLIPSVYSYLWAVVSVPTTFIIAMSLGNMLSPWNLPIFSMPFCITVLSFLYFFSLKTVKGRQVLTPLQLFSPEKNLYSYLNNKERLWYTHTIRLHLPFLGKWLVSQGYYGNITHKDEWGQALDFIIVDNSLKTYETFAAKPEHFYCYGKPVLAPGAGFVQHIDDYIDDNAIGKINQAQNWGNSIIIKHAEGLYTKMSHLRKHSFTVKVGDYVKQGDVVAACGNSGRSPEPHLHFQVQATPYIGSKTMAYPFAHYAAEKVGVLQVHQFSTPQETEIVWNTPPNIGMQQAFAFLPGYTVTVDAENMPTGKWEVFTDAYNRSYIYCHHSKAVAFFYRTEDLFYFTSYEGDKNNLLYYFYVACYKVFLSTEPSFPVLDTFPLQHTKTTVFKWLQDVLAPFILFSRLRYKSLSKILADDIFNPSIIINSTQILQVLSFKKVINRLVVEVRGGKISNLSFQKNGRSITAIFRMLIVCSSLLFSLRSSAQESPASVDSKSLALFNDGQWKELVAYGKASIDSGTTFPLLRMRMGYAAHALGNYSQSLVQYKNVYDQDSTNTTALYYLYLNNLYLNNTAAARFYLSKLPDESKPVPLPGIKLAAIEAEYGYKITDEITREDAQYARIGVGLEIGARFELQQSLALYNQNIGEAQLLGVFDRDSIHIRQKEYYAKLGFAASGQVTVLGGFHYLYTPFNNLVYNNVISFSGVQYKAPFFHLEGLLHFGSLSSRRYSQFDGIISLFPLGNNKLYTVTKVTYGNEFVFSQAIGISVTKKMWLEGFATLGKFSTLLDNHALYVYNDIDQKVYKLGCSAASMLSKRLLFSINYAFDQKLRYGTSDKFFNQHSITGGLKWIF